jgi:uncharacterized protein YjdB
MRYARTLVALAAVLSLLACGGSSNNIASIQVSPPQAEGTAPNGAVNFTATGTFQDSQTRLLTTQDGIQWSSSDTAVATINSLTGQATCVAAGSAVITAKVPNDLTFQGGGHTSSTFVTGTAGLQCVLAG